MNNIAILLPYKDQFIKEAIDSVVNQNYTNWKLIVIDGASTDNSKKILEKFEKSFKKFLFIIVVTIFPELVSRVAFHYYLFEI